YFLAQERLEIPDRRPAESMDCRGLNCRMSVGSGLDLVCSNVGVTDAGNLLMPPEQFHPPFLDQVSESLHQRVGLPSPGPCFHEKTLAFINSCLNAKPRGFCGFLGGVWSNLRHPDSFSVEGLP